MKSLPSVGADAVTVGEDAAFSHGRRRVEVTQESGAEGVVVGDVVGRDDGPRPRVSRCRWTHTAQAARRRRTAAPRLVETSLRCCSPTS